MGPVETAIRRHVSEGRQLQTPTGSPFVVDRIDDRGIVLLLGAKQAPTRLSWSALEGVTELFRGRAWMRTTGAFETTSES